MGLVIIQSTSLQIHPGSVRQSLFFAVILLLFLSASADANPYLARPGERHVSVRIATCAVSGGFTHLYTALDNHLFDKYGLKVEQVYIRGSSPALAALAADEIQFLYCAADATIPSLAGGLDVKLVAAPLVKPPHLLITRKEIRRLEELKGKSLGIGRHGDLSDRLSKALVKKFNIPDVAVRPIGGSQSERYQAMAANIVQGVIITPPLDVRAKNDGFRVLFRLMDLDIPFIYSSLHTTSRFIHERPETVQRMVAAFAEAIHFADKYPAKTKASISRVMRVKDEEAQVAYNVYTKEIVDRRMIVPPAAVAESVEVARALGTPIKKKPEELYDNSFVNNLERSGFLKELWGK
jgi:ABC-type nitrate/sulfonate/bicarbonate transport system substrate-binding protein